ncbi:hypothetical protein DYB32_010008, partial [Aphanomyces invadans]
MSTVVPAKETINPAVSVMSTTMDPATPAVFSMEQIEAIRIGDWEGIADSSAVIQHRQLQVEINALVDIGAFVSVINPDIWRLLGSPPLVQPKYGLISASNTKMPTKGLTKFVVSVGTCRAYFSLWVMDGAVSPCILGYNMLRKLGAVVNFTRALKARSLNAVRDGLIWVQVRNTGLDGVYHRKGDVVGLATPLPEQFMDNHGYTTRGSTDVTCSYRSPGRATCSGGEGVNVDEMKKIPVCAAVRTESPAPKEEIPIDWTNSSLSAEQKELLRKVLLRLDLFVTTSVVSPRL